MILISFAIWGRYSRKTCFPRCVPQRGSMIHVVNPPCIPKRGIIVHVLQGYSNVFFRTTFEFEYLGEFKHKIEILLNYHSGGPKEWFDEKNRGQKSYDTIPLIMKVKELETNQTNNGEYILHWFFLGILTCFPLCFVVCFLLYLLFCPIFFFHMGFV